LSLACIENPTARGIGTGDKVGNSMAKELMIPVSGSSMPLEILFRIPTLQGSTFEVPERSEVAFGTPKHSNRIR
jgi:hypothetical protein